MKQKLNKIFRCFLKSSLYFFSVIGLVSFLIFLIFIFNLKKNPDYLFSLSQKLRANYFYRTEVNYNQQFNQNKKFGEFCYRLMGGEIDQGKISLTLDQQTIRGTLYYDNQAYRANIDPSSLGLEFDQDQGVLSWQWYNWLGF